MLKSAVAMAVPELLTQSEGLVFIEGVKCKLKIV